MALSEPENQIHVGKKISYLRAVLKPSKFDGFLTMVREYVVILVNQFSLSFFNAFLKVKLT